VKRAHRVADGKAHIELRLDRAAQLFDDRDPTPFRARDLDGDAAEYLLAVSESIPRHLPLAISVLVADPDDQEPEQTIRTAIPAYFRRLVEDIGRQLREHRARAKLAFAMGLTIMLVFLSLALLVVGEGSGWRQVLREGMVVIGWVAMWRPMELVLYDWWPLVQQRRRLQRLADAEILVGR
jgi:hypothetical protein